MNDYNDKNYGVSVFETEHKKYRLGYALNSHKIKVENITCIAGPAISLYRINLAPGMRMAKVKRLEDDIAISLGSKGVRVVTLEDAIGIEVANEQPGVVSLKTILESPQYVQASEHMELPVALGTAVPDEPFCFDLANMPHLLIAGASGTGKTTALNIIISSLLLRKSPSEVKFLMIDPQKCEFAPYQSLTELYRADLPYANDMIISDTEKAVFALRSLIEEMDARYDLLWKARVRNITAYNSKISAHQLSPFSGHRYLPYIVVIIDELRDLLLTADRDIEEPLASLAAKARAVGIHLVVGTRHPTPDVITGNFKANFFSRIAFKVNSSVDSNTVLDGPDANRLIGNGDMLIIGPGFELTRVQGAMIDAPEIERVVNQIYKSDFRRDYS